MVIAKILPSKTILIRDMVQTFKSLLNSMQRLSLWEERKISFPDLQKKKEVINLMTMEPEKTGCTIINASGDADVDIVKAAVKASEHQPTTSIVEETDLSFFPSRSEERRVGKECRL